MPTDPGWTSLEIIKLVVSALSPVAVALLGLSLARVSRRVEAVQWANQTVVARRLEIFNRVAPQLNQLYCFGAFVGRWKETTPQQAVALKRDVDETMYANRVLFSDELFVAYQAFTATLFAEFARAHGDAPLRVQVASKWGDRRKLSWWNASSLALFTESNTCQAEDVQNAYGALGEHFRADLYVTHTERPLLANRSS